MSELENFLKSESDVGRHESGGSFGLNLERARQMLAKYQLPQAELYILKVVQAAVAGGARRMRFYTRPDGLEVHWDQADEQPNERAQQHLTAGLLAFLAHDHTACRLDNGQGEVLFQEGAMEPAQALQEWWSHRLVLRREPPPSSAWKRLTRWIPSQSPEQKRLVDGCTHAPIPIFLNDQVVNRLSGQKGKPGLAGVAVFPALTSQWLKGGYLLSQEASNQLFPAPPLAPEKRAVHALFEDPSDPSALQKAAPISTLLCDGQPALYCWASVHSHSSSWSEVTFIVDGVTLEPERNLLDRPGYQAFISARGLTTDLTGLSLVHNELYFERIKLVKGLLRRLEGE